MTPQLNKLIDNQEIILNELFTKNNYSGTFITANNCIEGLWGKAKLEESADIVVCNKNLLLPNYREKGYTTELNGVTIIVNDDYSLTLNGTCTESVKFRFINDDKRQEKFVAGTYAVTADSIYISSDNTNKWVGNGILTMDEEFYITYAGIEITAGTTYDNTIKYCQLELGDTATDYIEHQHQNLSGTNIDFKCYDGITHIYNNNDINMNVSIRERS